MTRDELLEAARTFKPTEEDFKRMNERMEVFEAECLRNGWKPGEYSGWLARTFSSM
jgi:hypothetical protein